MIRVVTLDRVSIRRHPITHLWEVKLGPDVIYTRPTWRDALTAARHLTGVPYTPAGKWTA